MIDMPSFVVFIGTAALVVVCALLAALLFYLILLARAARAFLAYAEAQARRVKRRFDAVRELFAFAGDFLAGWADYER
jgi:hypothetical protein